MAVELETLRELLASRYRVERELGRGGMATVYLAHDLRHDRAVAIKVLRPELAVALGPDRFVREITTSARLDHPHILPLLDSGEAAGLLYYVMPLVQGESLRDRLQREPQLPVDDAINIAVEVADALGHAHAQGIIHRDVKPENIMLAEGHARLADFGIARAMSNAGERLTATGMSIGTPAYMSPEQAGGDGTVDARSDIYSLGCVAYEMLVGQPPHTGATAVAIIARKHGAPPPGIRGVRPTVPAGLEAAIMKALARVPADRFATAKEFTRALGTAKAPAGHGPAAARSILIAVVLAVAVAAWLMVRKQPVDAAITSIAVLPFENLSRDPEQEYFASGMTEELIERLAGLQGVTVKSRTSVRRFRDSDSPLASIADTLGVGALIEGSVFRTADSVRIRVRLVQAKPERTVWVKSYDRGLRDLLDMQSEVARQVAKEIGAVVTPEHEQRMTRMSTVDPVATEAYFKGRFYWNRRTPDDLQRAIRQFEQALAVSPDYAKAYAGLADCYVLLAFSSLSVLKPAEALTLARVSAKRALELQEDLPEAHAALAYADTYEFNWEAAEQGFKRAIEIDPAYGTAHFWYAARLAAERRTEEAIAESRRAEEVEPVSPIIAAGVAWMLHLARRYDSAVAQAHRALALEPDFMIGRLREGTALTQLHRYDEARVALETGLRASGGNPGILSALVQVEAAAGRVDRARARLGELRAMATQRYVPAYSFAVAFAGLAQKDSAFAWLDRAFVERSIELAFIKVDPELDLLRDDTRFHSLIQRMRLP